MAQAASRAGAKSVCIWDYRQLHALSPPPPHESAASVKELSSNSERRPARRSRDGSHGGRERRAPASSSWPRTSTITLFKARAAAPCDLSAWRLPARLCLARRERAARRGGAPPSPAHPSASAAPSCHGRPYLGEEPSERRSAGTAAAARRRRLLAVEYWPFRRGLGKASRPFQRGLFQRTGRRAMRHVNVAALHGSDGRRVETKWRSVASFLSPPFSMQSM